MNEKKYGGAYKGIAITIWVIGTIASLSLGDSLKEAWYSDYNYTACFIGLIFTAISGSLFYAIGIGLNYLGQCRDALLKIATTETPQKENAEIETVISQDETVDAT